MGVRAFTTTTSVSSDHLALALAPALTPEGPVADPSFFHGFATEPQVLARGLLSLADITATRYFKYTPTTQRDPVLTAHGDRLRAEVFSACNSVYARFDLLASGMDGGDVARGT
ncbi:MAG TPA: SWIM zinc finger family protein, partial [Agromyces sp.]